MAADADVVVVVAVGAGVDAVQEVVVSFPVTPLTRLVLPKEVGW